jgi:hypothetical protein
MRRATQSLFILSLLSAGCSADGDLDPNPPAGTDGTDSFGSSSGTGQVSPTGGPSGTGTVSPTSGATGGTNVSDGTGGSVSPTGTSTDDTELPPPGQCKPGIPVTSQIPRMTPIQYDNALRDLLGVTNVGGKTPSKALGVEENKGAVTGTEWTAYQNVAAQIVTDVMGGAGKANFIACDEAAEGCLEESVRAFGLKVFRRPLTEEEVAQFMEFDNLTPKGTPTEVASAILNAFLVSPSFLLMPELSEEKEADSYKLTQYEIATRLATLMWRSVPDAVLLEAAKNNELGTPAQVLAQAERMIGDKAKVGPLLADFHKFFAEINSSSHWDRTEHDVAQFPEGVSKEAFSATMMAEVDQFFAEVAASGTFKDLFLSNIAFINKDNAAIYGEDPADYTAELKRVELDPMTRPGFLTRAAFLSSYSGYTKTSPILRGAYIGQKMLGAAAVPAKQGVPTEPPPGNYTTRREEVEALTSPDDCKSCHHQAINPPGFVMEMYDAMGRVQTKDPLGGDINMVADVNVDGQVQTINSPFELMSAIANGSSGRHKYAERWVEYATGRTPNGNDYCSVEVIEDKLASDANYTIVKLLADLSQTEPFKLRNAGN